MKRTKKSIVASRLLGMLVVLFGWVSVSSTPTAAQNGANAICTSAAGCTSVMSSSAFIDASVITGPGSTTDVCARIYGALTSAYPTTPRVIDARGINSGNSSMSCPSGDTPWTYGGNSTTTNALILLPPGTINILTTWIIPTQTRIMGLGRELTHIQWSAAANGDIIDMCNSACFGVGISDLTIDGSASVVNNGIVNNHAQEQSYVNNVNFANIEGIDLTIGSGAGNSGPYTNLVMGNQTGSSAACVQILNAETRGIHGLTCTLDGTPLAGIYLDGSNNTIEDAHFEGVVDGIVIGDSSSLTFPASGNTVINITGAFGSGAITNVVHICSATAGSAPCNSSPKGAQDVTISGVLGSYATNVLQDDVTGTTIAVPTSGSHAHVEELGLYVLGEQVGNGFSRFTTYPGVPTWGVGSAGPGAGSCTPGALFSSTQATGGNLWVCQGAGTWFLIH